MIYEFIDNQGTFRIKSPQRYNLYFPLTNKYASLISSISPNLSGDIKKNNEHFLTPPASIEDLRSSPLCRRDFFIKTDKEIIRLSSSYNDTLEAGFLYHKVIKKTKTLEIGVLNFIPHDLPVEIMRVKVKNIINKPLKIIPTSFIPLFCRAEKNLRDHRHVSSLLNRIQLDKYGILVKPAMIFNESGHSINKTTYFVLGFEGKKVALLGQFPILDFFYGEGDLYSPDAIIKDILPINKKNPGIDGKEACAALRFKEVILKPEEEKEYFLIMGLSDDPKEIRRIFARLDSPAKINNIFQATRKYWLDYLRGSLEFDFKDKNFNNWLLWVKLQPTLRKLLGCSFLPHFDYGKGGRGWRDLWQDALSLLLLDSGSIREFLLNNFKGVRIDGSNATIITKEGEFISDRNRINRVWMDHGVWPYLTLRLYLNKTGDLGILLKEVAYFSDHQFRRAKETISALAGNDYLLHSRNKRIYQGSILEHILVQHLVQFFNVGEHNIIRLENADWNDGLDMASRNGESVAFSFMYAYNLRDICVYLEALKSKAKSVELAKELILLLDKIGIPLNYNNYKEKQKRLEEYFNQVKNISGRKIKIDIDSLILDLKDKSAHLSSWLRKKEWLALGFFNGYYDNKALRVEGKIKGRVRMMLPSQVFALMSGVASKEQAGIIWQTIKKYLKDWKLGGFKLNTDFGSVYMELGRAFGFAYGDKENGAFFNHMVVMLANALYKQGLVKEGFEVINSIYKMAVSDKAKIGPVIPEYFNAQGRGLYSYLTGSASWYIYTLLEEVLGVKFILGDLCIDPKLVPANFFKQSIDFKFNFHYKIIKVSIIKGAVKKKAYQVKEVLLEGEKIPSSSGLYIIKKSAFRQKINNLKVYLH
ncbi:MAG: cellobiose phosphorylase [Candidatus Omnitrophota bacterium]